jgi:hypothetical protein
MKQNLTDYIRVLLRWYPHLLRADGLMRSSNLLQQVIEGKIKGGIEVTGRNERRRRKLMAPSDP